MVDLLPPVMSHVAHVTSQVSHDLFIIIFFIVKASQ